MPYPISASGVIAFLGLALAGCAESGPSSRLAVPQEPIRIEVELGTEGRPAPRSRPRVTLIGLTKTDEGKLLGMDGPGAFRVYVADDPERTPVLGRYWFQTEGQYAFEPRFPLQPGLKYRAEFQVSRLRPDAEPGLLVKEFGIPKPETPPAAVEQVYPTSERLPENQLKFYIHFTAPMSRGDSYRFVKLLQADGKEVDSPFLELGEELWDAEQRRFTLFIDPGRIKRGLKPREDVGPALEEGKSYTLAIDRNWRDAHGEPLKETFRKSFSVGPPIEQAIDPKAWQLSPPSQPPQAAGAPLAQPLTVTFPRPLDHAMLQRVITVVDGEGQTLEGRITITREETSWQFIPKQPWRAGPHRLVVQTHLEDLAGNSIGKAFDVDVFKQIDSRIKTETMELPFEVKID